MFLQKPCIFLAFLPSMHSTTWIFSFGLRLRPRCLSWPWALFGWVDSGLRGSVCLGWLGTGDRVPAAHLSSAPELLGSSPEDRIPDNSLLSLIHSTVSSFSSSLRPVFTKFIWHQSHWDFHPSTQHDWSRSTHTNSYIYRSQTFPLQRDGSSSAALSKLSFHKYLLALIFNNTDCLHDKHNHFAISHPSGLV